LHDVEGSFGKNYGLGSDAVILVRPDGYIARIATHDVLTTITSAATSLVPPSTTQRFAPG
jgi:hypothetical protein